MQKKLFSLFLSLAIAFSILPFNPVTAKAFPALPTVYVNGTNGNDTSYGETAKTAVKTMARAYSMVDDGGTIVICGNTDAVTETLPAKSVTITSKTDTEDFTTSSAWLFSDSYGIYESFSADVTLENMNIYTPSSIYHGFVANGNSFNVGDGVAVQADQSYYSIDVIGGCREFYGSGAQDDVGVNITINSGSNWNVYGAGCFEGDNSEKLKNTKDININIGGDAGVLNLCSGFDSNVNATAGQTVPVSQFGDININVNDSAVINAVYLGSRCNGSSNIEQISGKKITFTDSQNTTVYMVYAGDNIFGYNNGCTSKISNIVINHKANYTTVIYDGGRISYNQGYTAASSETIENIEINVYNGAITLIPVKPDVNDDSTVSIASENINVSNSPNVGYYDGYDASAFKIYYPDEKTLGYFDAGNENNYTNIKGSYNPDNLKIGSKKSIHDTKATDTNCLYTSSDIVAKNITVDDTSSAITLAGSLGSPLPVITAEDSFVSGGGKLYLKPMLGTISEGTVLFQVPAADYPDEASQKSLLECFALKDLDGYTLKYQTGEYNGKTVGQIALEGAPLTLTYNANGGVGDDITETHRSGESFTAAQNTFTYDGKRFGWWSAAANGYGMKYAAGLSATMPSTNMTLYAHWIDSDMYVFTLDPNGGKSATGSPFVTESCAKNTLGLDNYYSYSNEGYYFKGWNTKADGTGTAYKTTDVFIMPANDVTLYAQWSTDPSFTLTFESAQADGDKSIDVTVNAGTEITLPENTFTNDGYRFVGWSYDGTYPSSSMLKPGDKYKMPARDTKLDAVWIENGKYYIIGTVKSSDGSPIVGQHIEYMPASLKYAPIYATTDTNGEYDITIVREKGAGNIIFLGTNVYKTETKLITVTGDTVGADFTVNNNDLRNSIRTSSVEDGVADIPNIAVGGINTIAENTAQNNTTITLSIVGEKVTDTNTDQVNIREISGTRKLPMFLNIMLTKTVNGVSADIGSDNEQVLEIAVPYDFSNKSNLAVYRCHNLQAEAFNELSSKPESGYTDGTFYCDKANSIIYIYANKFSTYAIGYTYESGGGGGSASAGSYSVNFDTNGGSAITSASVTSGNTLSLDDYKTTKDGYDFAGWCTDSTLTKAVTEITVTADTTLYANIVKSSVNSMFTKKHVAYISGRENGLIDPKANITRGEAASVLYRLLSDDIRSANRTTKNSFTDMNDKVWCNTEVSTLAAMGAINGRADNSFGQNDNITRAEMIKMLVCLSNSSMRNGESLNISHMFTDTAGHWAEKYIYYAVTNQWISGYGDGKFDPDAYITRAEAIVMINKMLGRTPASVDSLLDGMKTWSDNSDTTLWYYLPVQEATNSHEYITDSSSGYEKWTALTN